MTKVNANPTLPFGKNVNTDFPKWMQIKIFFLKQGSKYPGQKLLN